MMSRLDKLYGRPIQPNYIRPVEWTHKFSAVFQLNSQTAEYFEDLRRMPIMHPSFRTIAFNLCFLWVVDNNGEIWIALEEMCIASASYAQVPRMRNLPSAPGLEALGHPVLVSNKSARIGGELNLDEDSNTVSWIINNKSGRYGHSAERTSDHLENVASEFFRVGIRVSTDYVAVRR